MPEFWVKQLLVRERVIRVVASSQQEAREKAMGSEGVIVSYPRTPKLLTDYVFREPPIARAALSVLPQAGTGNDAG